VLRDEAREVRGGAERAAVDLGQAEGRVVGGDDDVGVADEADAASISLMSTPAFQPLPSAARITTRTLGSLPRRVTSSASSNHPRVVSALTGGLSMTISAMPPSIRCEMPMATFRKTSRCGNLTRTCFTLQGKHSPRRWTCPARPSS
jgi:hypothetical protein